MQERSGLLEQGCTRDSVGFVRHAGKRLPGPVGSGADDQGVTEPRSHMRSGLWSSAVGWALALALRYSGPPALGRVHPECMTRHIPCSLPVAAVRARSPASGGGGASRRPIRRGSGHRRHDRFLCAGIHLHGARHARGRPGRPPAPMPGPLLWRPASTPARFAQVPSPEGQLSGGVGTVCADVANRAGGSGCVPAGAWPALPGAPGPPECRCAGRVGPRPRRGLRAVRTCIGERHMHTRGANGRPVTEGFCCGRTRQGRAGAERVRGPPPWRAAGALYRADAPESYVRQHSEKSRYLASFVLLVPCSTCW